MKIYFSNRSICYPGVLFLHITVGKMSHNYQNVGFKPINYPTVLQITERRDQDTSDLTKEDYNEADRIFNNKKREGKKKQIIEISQEMRNRYHS